MEKLVQFEKFPHYHQISSEDYKLLVKNIRVLKKLTKKLKKLYK